MHQEIQPTETVNETEGKSETTGLASCSIAAFLVDIVI